ncbi:MAG: trigger factor [Ignavibacteria bacterium RBG_13_36_8]|nr:MAG: trigger factor [Ignavibacteria bacterium RBG_13_36_8]
MESKVNILSDNEHELEVNLKYPEIKSEIEEAYKEERKNIELPGFRKGKVPIDMLKKLYGEAIEYKTSEKIATKKFWDIVDDKNLKPISTPQLTDIDFEKGNKLFFKVKYEIMPKLELKEYKGLEIEKPLFKVKEEDVQKEIDYILKTNASYKETDMIENNNFRITVNLQKLDEAGIPVIGSRSENIGIDLTDERVNAQIKENAVGKKKSEEFSFEFTDEHSHGEEKHTVTHKYTAEIIKVEKIIYPELTDEFIKIITKEKANTVEELKTEIRTKMEKYYGNQSENIFDNSLINEVVKRNDFTPPTGYVSLLLDRFVESEKEEAKRKGYANIDEKVLRENLKQRAEWNAKWQIILNNLADTENIKVEESEIESLAKVESEKTGISFQKLLKFYKDSNRTNTLLEEKVIKFLKDSNTAKEVDPEKKKVQKKG